MVKGLDKHFVEKLIDDLEKSFIWYSTPQGHEYWEQVSKNLASLINDDTSKEILIEKIKEKEQEAIESIRKATEKVIKEVEAETNNDKIETILDNLF